MIRRLMTRLYSTTAEVADASSGLEGPRITLRSIRASNDRYRPSNFGSRFSMNAFMPSAMSCVLNSGRSWR